MSKKTNIKISDSLESLLNIKTKRKPTINQINSSKKSTDSGTPLEKEPFSQIFLEKMHQIQVSDSQIITYINSPAKINRVYITAKAFDEIIMLATAVNEISKDRWGPDSAKLEVYCYVLGEKQEFPHDKPQIITDIYIPYHQASETNVVVPEEGILEVKDYIEEHQKVVLGWAHSHGHYEVYSSETDEVNHLTLLQDTSNFAIIGGFRIKYIYGITVNDKGTHLGVILTQFPCQHIQRAEDHQFEIIGESYTKEEYIKKYKEIKAMLIDRVNVKQPETVYSEAEQIHHINEELLTNFAIKMRKAKNILFERIPEDLDGNFNEIQQVLKEYDTLLLDSAEESFLESSKELIRTIRNLKEIR
ncbi:MAG: hypothetical protein DRO88_03900 [Promethearchaeia archaeon]|nr:MAG: hypothetical protein DRO88_03900 [Candidatus Lokiarchaeia archaeon]